MPTPANRLSLSFAALLLGCTAMSSGAQAGWFDFGSSSKTEAPDKKAVEKSDVVKPAATLDGSIRQAQLLRLDGQYPEAIKHLSQLMLIASDDSRVITEYGKTLAAMGRAQEAVNFLSRAEQLSPTDWTVFSAIGVAYDQLGKQTEAKDAYEHALVLKPGEPSVLNNYALSRMLAKDPEGAAKLIARAESAGGASDPKIARNIAMIKDLAPEAATIAVAANTPEPVKSAVQAAPRAPVAQRPMPQAVAANQTPPFVNIPSPPPLALPTAAPRQLAADTRVIGPSANLVQPGRVVMQRVPVDPLAGPVEPKIAATHAPRALTKATEAKATEVAAVEKPAASAPAPSRVTSHVKTAAAEALDLQAKAEAIAKKLAGKPAAIAAAKAEASKPVTQPQPTKVAETKPAPAKVADAKPAPAKAAPVKTAAKPKDSIPTLRLSANAY